MSAYRNAVFDPISKKWRMTDTNGYVRLYDEEPTPRNYTKFVYEHRQVLEDKLKRKLLSSEIVHHGNTDRASNVHDNLHLVDDHLKHVREEHPFWRTGRPDLTKLTLVSSNKNKIDEYKKFGLPDIKVRKGADLPEIDGDAVTVALYKAKAAGPGKIVDDASVDIQGAGIGVNVRWLLDKVPHFAGRYAEDRCVLGVNDGKYLRIYEGMVPGKVTNHLDKPADAFGFDPHFIPNGGGGKTSYELKKHDKSYEFSPRRIAIQNLIENKPVKVMRIERLPDWDGKWQKTSSLQELITVDVQKAVLRKMIDMS